jgi:hypothetical protein
MCAYAHISRLSSGYWLCTGQRTLRAVRRLEDGRNPVAFITWARTMGVTSTSPRVPTVGAVEQGPQVVVHLGFPLFQPVPGRRRPLRSRLGKLLVFDLLHE